MGRRSQCQPRTVASWPRTEIRSSASAGYESKSKRRALNINQCLTHHFGRRPYFANTPEGLFLFPEGFRESLFDRSQKAFQTSPNDPPRKEFPKAVCRSFP